ncbi:MAG TPA: 2-oxo acid dehydrogenase subunit E2, partial [Pirellulaceae bacterium]|nr:2-oxo acid dehydrogenase subunit E2 [Pirellulaceae bacterium]
ADRMLASVRSTAAVTLTSRADATNLVALRRQFQAAAAGADAFVPSYTELIARLAAGVLAQHPRLNACWQNDGLLEVDSVNLGIAVDTDAGLVVPVVKGAERLSLRDLAGRVRAAIERARQRRLSTDDLSGGTFTITSLGMFGVDAFTPILNPPQVAILGVGRITREPAAVDEQVAIRDSLWLSLTFDHRAVDGAPAAKLLSDLRAAIENPGPRLVA